MYIAARKRRYRRIRNSGIANLHARMPPIVFDRLEYLQHQIHKQSLAEPLDIILMTGDNYFSLALTESVFKHQRTHVCATLDEAETLLSRNPQPRMLIDLDGVSEAAIDVLDTTRRWHRTWPELNIMQFATCRCQNIARLIDAASRFPVVERRQTISELLKILNLNRNEQELVFSPPAPLSHREWNILLAVAKGDSLKTIALSFNKPYHFVVYTLGRIATRLGLKNNKALIHLLNKLSSPLSGKE